MTDADGSAMNADRLDEELLALLPRRRGHFRLESGHHGDLWLDLDSLLLRPARLRRFAAALALRLGSLAIEAVCGPLVGGAFVAQAVAAELDVEFYYTERVAATGGGGLYSASYRLPDTLRPRIGGKKVAIVDDAVNAGSAVRATCLELRASGARPAAVGALLVLGSPAAQLADGWDVPLARIAHLPSERWGPEACPLCASGMPLDEGARLQDLA
jgi:orotate phosphoribosyltransferase